MSETSCENFFDNPTFVNSGLVGGDSDFSSFEINQSWDNYYSTLNVGNPISKNAPDESDHIKFNPPTFNLNMGEDTNKNGFWKYEEDKTLKEIEQYLSSTYHSHYTSEQSKTQTLDLIESIGDAECSKAIGSDNIKGFNFNYFEPDYSINIKGSLIYTVALS